MKTGNHAKRNSEQLSSKEKQTLKQEFEVLYKTGRPKTTDGPNLVYTGSLSRSHKAYKGFLNYVRDRLFFEIHLIDIQICEINKATKLLEKRELEKNT